MVEDAAVLEAVRDLGPASTREIADSLGCSVRATEYRLRKLYADGKVDSRTVGNALVWSPANGADAAIDRAD